MGGEDAWLLGNGLVHYRAKFVKLVIHLVREISHSSGKSQGISEISFLFQSF